jgi:hypothetical protein
MKADSMPPFDSSKTNSPVTGASGGLGAEFGAEDKRFEPLRGLHPNTLSKSAGPCTGTLATVREQGR